MNMEKSVITYLHFVKFFFCIYSLKKELFDEKTEQLSAEVGDSFPLSKAITYFDLKLFVLTYFSFITGIWKKLNNVS